MAQQVQTAQFLPKDTAAELTGELVCYGRSVVGIEWDARTLALGGPDQPPGAEMFHTLEVSQPQTATEQSAYDRWMDQTAQREQARVARVHGAEGNRPAARVVRPVLYFRCHRGLHAVLRRPQ